MTEYSDVMTILDKDGAGTVLYHLCNDLFDTVCLVYDDGGNDERCYLLWDMQGEYPTSLADVPDYDWIPAEEQAEI